MTKSKNYLYSGIALVAVLFLGFLFMLAPLGARASSQELNLDFTIQSYDVTVNVNDQNVAQVFENIKVRFSAVGASTLVRGIVRDLPTSSRVTRIVDGVEQTKNYSYSISDISVLYDKTNSGILDGNILDAESYDGGISVFMRGDPVDANAVREYRIEYSMHLPDDRIATSDEFYYNIIGVNWGCPIENASYSVTLLKPFDGYNIAVYLGEYGSTTPGSFSFNSSTQTISGTASNLEAFEGVTVRVFGLENGYFLTSTRNFGWDIALLLATLGIAALAIFIRVKYGRKDRPVPVVEFYSPDGLTPSELPYALSGFSTDKDLAPMIIYWASKGYLKIEEDKNITTLEKLAPLPAKSKNFEKVLFDAIFNKGNRVKLNDLGTSIGEQAKLAKEQIPVDLGQEVWDSKSQVYEVGLTFLALLPLLCAFFMCALRAFVPYALVLVVIAGLCMLLTTSLLVWGNDLGERLSRGGIATKLLALIPFGLMIALLAIYLPETYVDPFGLKYIALAVFVLVSILATGMNKRTLKNNILVGRIIGFRNFLDVTEKDRIKMLVKENPNYFFDVLPYAYALGVADNYVKKFQGIAISTPDWYSSTSNVSFTPILFLYAMNASLAGFSNTLRYTPSTTMGPRGGTDGGFGGGLGGGFGGGFGGGGFGGGGGGSAR